MIIRLCLFFLVLVVPVIAAPRVSVGAEQLFTEQYIHLLRNKKIGLVTNQTAVDSHLVTTIDNLKKHSGKYNYKIIALFGPEHGINGSFYAEDAIKHGKDSDGIPIYSLYNKNKRPTPEMLKDINLLIFDIQDIGSRSYTYVTTLFYVMEEAVKAKIPVLVLDRPNPINGRVIDGPMMEERLRSIVGYLNVPYVHGMTVGELAKYFNEEYKVGCKLNVIPMKGWKRSMTFMDTGLPWVPTSPHIPDAQTPLYYPVTGIVGEISMVNIGIGYTLPFKLIGADWIDPDQFAAELNKQNFPGVIFKPFYFKPFYGSWIDKNCQGVLVVITDHLQYKPVSTQYLIIGILKSLYPQKFKEALEKSKDRKDMFAKINGTDKIWFIMSEQRNIVWKLRAVDEEKRQEFIVKRNKFLIPEYGS